MAAIARQQRMPAARGRMRRGGNGPPVRALDGPCRPHGRCGMRARGAGDARHTFGFGGTDDGLAATVVARQTRMGRGRRCGIRSLASPPPRPGGIAIAVPHAPWQYARGPGIPRRRCRAALHPPWRPSPPPPPRRTPGHPARRRLPASSAPSRPSLAKESAAPRVGLPSRAGRNPGAQTTLPCARSCRCFEGRRCGLASLADSPMTAAYTGVRPERQRQEEATRACCDARCDCYVGWNAREHD